MGGSHLKEVADQFLLPLVGIGGFGFWEPLLKIRELWNARKMAFAALDERPTALILVDFYGFNIHVARRAKKLNIPVFYYVSPQVWASRKRRIHELGKVVTRMLVIFPFEEKLYQEAHVPVTYVGHPLVDRLPPPVEPALDPTVGLLPGSRRSVVARHLPIVIQTAIRLRERNPKYRFVLFRPREIEPAFYADALRTTPWIQLEEDVTYAQRRRLWLAIGVSGTAALENMLLGIPMIIMYRLSWMTYWIARLLIKIPFIGIPNILAGQEICPERIQNDANPRELAQTAQIILDSPEKRSVMRATLLNLRASLQSRASEKVAALVVTA